MIYRYKQVAKLMIGQQISEKSLIYNDYDSLLGGSMHTRVIKLAIKSPIVSLIEYTMRSSYVIYYRFV